MRNNADRIGVVPDVTDDMVEQQQPQTTPLSFPAPTEFVSLPSRGKFYPEESPLCGKESLEIRFMSAVDEDILTNKSLLKKGLAIDRLISSLLVDKSIAVDSLLVGDKNALLIAARISAYGSDYAAAVTCPNCGHKFENVFDLSTIAPKPLPENVGSDGTVFFTLPKTKANVVCKLLCGRDEKWLSQQTEMKKKHKLADTPLTDQLRMLILSVNGSTDKAVINRFVETLPAFDSRFLRSEYLKSVPDVNTDFTVMCPECDTEEEISLPMATSFLWPK